MDVCPTCRRRWGDCPHEPGQCPYIKTRETDDREPDGGRLIWIAGALAIFLCLVTYWGLLHGR